MKMDYLYYITSQKTKDSHKLVALGRVAAAPWGYSADLGTACLGLSRLRACSVDRINSIELVK